MRYVQKVIRISNLLSFKNHYQYILDTFTLDSNQTFCKLTYIFVNQLCFY